MCNKSQAIQILAQAYLMCRDIFGEKLRDAYLYGSYARGDYDDESDVDILMTVDMSAEELSLIRHRVSSVNSELSLEHDVTVSITAKPLEQFTRYSGILPYYRNVLSEGIRYAG
ncbi:MAG: nucleotidyltransferase domain-containing protein [Ruminococcus sp.]|nr:nucleotidyltransferase domain-containing protein [Ruminococcus sp.]